MPAARPGWQWPVFLHKEKLKPHLPCITANRRKRIYGRSRAPVIVLDPDDVVLAEIAAGLDLDQFQQNLAGIFQPMDRADRDMDRFVLVHGLDEFIDRYARRAAHDDPVLGAVMMLLQ